MLQDSIYDIFARNCVKIALFLKLPRKFPSNWKRWNSKCAWVAFRKHQLNARLGFEAVEIRLHCGEDAAPGTCAARI